MSTELHGDYRDVQHLEGVITRLRAEVERLRGEVEGAKREARDDKIELENLRFTDKRDAKEAQQIAAALGIDKEDWLYLHDFVEPINTLKSDLAAMTARAAHFEELAADSHQMVMKIQAERDAAEQARARAMGALRFYAARGTYEPDAVEAAGAQVSVPGTEPIWSDCGQKAEQALAAQPDAATNPEQPSP